MGKKIAHPTKAILPVGANAGRQFFLIGCKTRKGESKKTNIQ
jgi:hypothetical protein